MPNLLPCRIGLAGALLLLAVGCSSGGTVTAPPATNPPTPPPVSPPVTQRQWIDEAYGPLSQHRVDLYLPATGDGPFRLIIWVHGGGWRNGDKALAANSFQRRALAQGFALASVGYRLSGVAKWPAQIHDVKAAVRHLRANARRFALDSTRFGAWGSSAGAHLVAVLGTSGGVQVLEGTIGTTSASSRVQAVANFFGPTDFLQMDAQLIAVGCNPPGTVEQGLANSETSQLLGAPIGLVPALVAQANPLTYVAPDDPPFLIDHGKADCVVPYPQSVILDAALRGPLGIGPGNVTTTLVDGAGHGGAQITSNTNVDRVITFFSQALR
jgi:acetyl esterase/lipase